MPDSPTSAAGSQCYTGFSDSDGDLSDGLRSQMHANSGDHTDTASFESDRAPVGNNEALSPTSPAAGITSVASDACVPQDTGTTHPAPDTPYAPTGPLQAKEEGAAGTPP